METSQIQRLIAKYFEGDTSLEEESILSEYFTGKEAIEEKLLPLKIHFELLKAGREKGFAAESLEDRIMAKIENYENQKDPGVRKLYLSRWLIAASIVLILGISVITFYKIQYNRNRDTFTDPQLAYLETQKALLYVSEKMNKGIEPLSNLSKINTATDKLRNLNKIDKSLGMLNLVSFMNQSSNMKK